MKITEMLRKVDYTRITVGDRWLIHTFNGWEVLERKRYGRATKHIIVTKSEDEAVNELLKGEELYSDHVH